MWNVVIKKKVLKNLKKLPVDVQERFAFLTKDLENSGPEQITWKNYSKLGKEKYHCHLGYRHVAC